VAATLSHGLVAQSREGSGRVSPRYSRLPPRLLADGHTAHQFAGWIRNGFASLAHVVDRQEDGLARVGKRFVGSVSLAVAARKSGDDGDVTAVSVGLEYDVVAALIHLASLFCSPPRGHALGAFCSGSG
jgi:hypothetical protein